MPSMKKFQKGQRISVVHHCSNSDGSHYDGDLIEMGAFGVWVLHPFYGTRFHPWSNILWLAETEE